MRICVYGRPGIYWYVLAIGQENATFLAICQEKWVSHFAQKKLKGKITKVKGSPKVVET